ncbi:MAG: hypothetical protein Q7R45_00675, partial [Sulfuricaulis sp.]|nr:hypothetical protein [Sulfuricaulis sp.]
LAQIRPLAPQEHLVFAVALFEWVNKSFSRHKASLIFVIQVIRENGNGRITDRPQGAILHLITRSRGNFTWRRP